MLSSKPYVPMNAKTIPLDAGQSSFYVTFTMIQETSSFSPIS